MIDIEPHGDITILRMANGKANAQSTEFCHALTRSMREHAEAPSRALIITGTGNVFSAGVDLLRALEEGSDYLRGFLPVLDECFQAVFMHSKPVVAAVNGHAIAGGCIVAAAADRRIMSRAPARIGVPELLVGVPFPPLALEIVRNALAQSALESLIFTGRLVDPQRALECGLVHELVEDDELMKRAVETAEHLGRIRPEVYRLTKAELREPCLSRAQAASAAQHAVEAIWTAPETLGAIEKYVSATFKQPRP